MISVFESYFNEVLYRLSVTQLAKKENYYFNETYLNIFECNPDIPDLTILKGHIYFHDQNMKLKPPLSFYF